MKKQKDELQEMMEQGVSEAVAFAKESGYDLDFSDESIQRVEPLLGEVRDHWLKTKEEGVNGIALILAASIGEVTNRKTGEGEWGRDHPDFGEDTFPFYWKGHTTFLYAWCMKRIFDGDGDNVWFKYQALILKSPLPNG